MKRRVLIFVAVMALAISAVVSAMCVGIVPGDFYTDREVSYYRGPGGQVLQDVDSADWSGCKIYFQTQHFEWPLFGKADLDSFHADHPPHPKWFFGHLPRPNPMTHITVRKHPFLQRIGFYAGSFDDRGFVEEHRHVLAIPAWFFLPPLIAFGIIMLRRQLWLYHKNRGRLLCPGCGYDLLATPDRCPECGKSAAAIPPTTAP